MSKEAELLHTWRLEPDVALQLHREGNKDITLRLVVDNGQARGTAPAQITVKPSVAKSLSLMLHKHIVRPSVVPM